MSAHHRLKSPLTITEMRNLAYAAMAFMAAAGAASALAALRLAKPVGDA
ncbi:MAG: hypothetical protein AB7S93_24920 [Xanthobacteraceae bacterium]